MPILALLPISSSLLKTLLVDAQCKGMPTEDSEKKSISASTRELSPFIKNELVTYSCYWGKGRNDGYPSHRTRQFPLKT